MPDFPLDRSLLGGYDELKRSFDRISFESPSQYARDYIWAFIDHRIPREILQQDAPRGQYDVTIIDQSSDIASLTKRTSLIADKLILAQAGQTHSHVLPTRRMQNGYDQYILETVTVHAVDEAPSVGGWTGDAVQYNLPTLGSYLRDVAPLISAGQLIYYPDIRVKDVDFDDSPDSTGSGWQGYSDRSESDLVTLRRFTDFVTQGRRILERSNANLLRDKLVTPILSVDLPIIEGTTLRDFCDISTNESEAFVNAQRYLRGKLLDISVDDEGQLAIDLVRLTLEIQESVAALTSESKNLLRKNSVQYGRGALATVAATLVLITGADLANLIAVVGASGGAFAVIAAAVQHLEERSKIRRAPSYFFWLLEKQKRI